MIAALPMYDRPETARAHDQLWSLIRRALGHAPQQDWPRALTRSEDLWALWEHPDLLLAQTCGYPYRARLHDRVRLVASPVWDLPDAPADCPPGYYYSVIVARRTTRTVQDCDGGVFAYNEALSQSGWAGPKIWADAQGLRFGALLETGAHRQSAMAVAEGRADWAGLDVISWQMMTRYDDFARELHVLAQTKPTPALPYITALTQDPARIRDALGAAIETLPAEPRAILALKGITWIDPHTYKAVPTPPPPASKS